MKISRRNFLAVAGAAAAAAALTACGGSSASSTSTASSAAASSSAASGAADGAEKIAKVALTCDTGTIDDESFNQACWAAVSSYMGDNCQYYIPDSDASDEDRETMIRQAVNDGADVIVCVGYLYGASLAWAAEQYPDIKFIAIDVTQGDIGTDSIPANCYCITFKEEQAGYLAGYAVVKDGYTKLGFTGGGGGTNPACCRYGYGFVQGADAAAKELNEKVEMNYSWQYGATFSASPELQTMAAGWYQAGTEVIFACGGSMFASVVAAAGAEEGKVIGVDVDQSFESTAVITSAMKGLADSVQWALGKFYAGEFASIGGVQTSLGANENAVGLPTATWSLTKWSVDDYNAKLQEIKDGKIAIDNNYDNLASTENVTLNIVG